MFYYKKYCLKEVIQIERDELEEDVLYDIFLLHPKRTVYVTESQKVKGVVTFGDFKRKIRSKRTGFLNIPDSEFVRLVNTNFTFVSVTGESEIYTLLDQRSKDFSIPVLDGQGRILREYSKEKQTEKKSFEIVNFLLQVYKEIDLIRDCHVYIVVGEWNFNIAKIADNGKENVHIVQNLSAQEMKQIAKQDNHFVYDLRYEYVEIISYFYSKYGLNYYYLTEEIIHMLDQHSLLFAHYKQVAILDCNDYFAEKEVKNRYILNKDRLEWNFQYNCYEYLNPVENREFEMIYTVFPLSENSYIKWGDSFIPFCAMLAVDRNSTYNCDRSCKINDSDIALNIIPELEKHGVKCIVIDNVQSRYSGWERILNINPEQAASRVCYDSKFSTIDRQTRWGVVYKNGYLQLQDVHMDDVTFCFGERCPLDMDDKLNTVYIFGPCIVWGVYVSDQDSIGSLLRNKIGDKFNVKACGIGWNNMNYAMREKTYYPGDIAIIFANDRYVYDFNNIPVFDIMDAYRTIKDIKFHIRDLPYHCDAEVIRNVVEKIFDICEAEGCLQVEKGMEKQEAISFVLPIKKRFEIPQELEQWLKSAQKHRVVDVGNSGAIVMNCNPFTRGHRYLIEESAKKVNVLYIFVVEENKSYFEFDDRIKMVKMGVSDLKNVVVIPSGKYMISSETLPGYFEKDVNSNLELDATQDLDLFGGVIAKAFDIVIRFAGEEPEDAVTRQYNQQMRSILPKYGVEFIEIPRKVIGEKVISASSVRKYMKNKEYEKVRELVLPQIYSYLKRNYFNV